MAFVSLAIIVLVAFASPFIASAIPGKPVPETVFLLVLGAVLGPHMLGVIHVDAEVSLVSELGLAFLFLLAGFEIDPKNITGVEGRYGMATWVVTFGIAWLAVRFTPWFSVSHFDGIAVTLALTSTALGTLVPIMRERSLTGTRVGDSILAYGTWGELGPVLAMSVLLSARTGIQTLVILGLFAVVCVLLAVVPSRSKRVGSRFFAFVEERADTTSQTFVRLTVLILVTLVAFSAIFDLDIVLGSFAAGFVLRYIIPEGNHTLETKLDGLAYGFLIPVFFTVSGAKIDLTAVASRPGLLVGFIVALLIIRAVPILVSMSICPETRDVSAYGRITVALYCTTALPIIVAVNKIDKQGANPDRVLQQLTEYELVPEEWGGQTIVCNISAKFGQGIDNLLEMVLLTAEMADLKANPNRKAHGTVIEAKLDKGRGPVATLLVQNGTLHAGDTVIAGTSVGRVRAMTNDDGKKIESAGPSVPVEIIGLAEVPGAGDIFDAVDDEKMARELVEQRKDKEKEERNKLFHKVTLDNLFDSIQQGEMKELNIIVKADVQGSVEAVRSSLEKLTNDEVRVRVIHGAVGAINESDVMLAAASGAIIVGFNVRPDRTATDSAAQQGVDMRMYRVIYDAIEEMEQAMKGMLEPKFKEVVLGHAEVRQVFKITGAGAVAGCYVQDGKIQRNAEVRVVRDGIVFHEGHLNTLKRFKDDVKEVATSYECGMSIENYNDIKEGDIIECFVMEEVKQ